MYPGLSILIPTFDRPHEVTSRLNEIQSQFHGCLDIHVQVNPGMCSVSDIELPSFSANISLNQNIANLGFIANVVSGLSCIRSEWVWILGDDDNVANDARAVILRALSSAMANGDVAIVFNQWSRPLDNSFLRCVTINELVQATGFSDCLFISGVIWNTRFLKGNINLLVDYSFTWASHALILLSCLSDSTGSVLVHRSSLINYRPAHRWSRLDYLRRIDKIFYCPSIRPNNALVFRFLWPQLFWAFQSSLDEINGIGELGAWSCALLKFMSRSMVFSGPLLTLRRLSSIFSELLGFCLRRFTSVVISAMSNLLRLMRLFFASSSTLR